ncbi:protein of unassigned function [Methylobacterium oryzae CBMB20]|uniref:Protein of unassigned function n=1 Tax=Methylobacterium oryzae CBMB20 TaxID=693986 RepID=A0A089NZS0_9HYPH|nr:protein of unassigned function [Methylobacterium oryzae CBMB20]
MAAASALSADWKVALIIDRVCAEGQGDRDNPAVGRVRTP